MKIFTIGFTQKSAEQFFTRLNQPGLVRLIDTRLNNTSQLAGFTKMNDLRYFSRKIGNLDYLHLPQLAPTKDILDAYRKNGGDWDVYEKQYLDLIAQRRIETTIDRSVIEGGCLLCSEATPHHCHRRLVAEYLGDKWGEVNICHL
ncbi:DUF488 family protein [Nitrosovibrio tenuis]|uniref:DUF488 domain-containing protein n=1 Tax=Nitrosovibrio tenuis TaxID=1233 RepID=A0A1H7P9F4_9PROT|nr:DUF488 domain-containing protein [Nitrosovibrio tenuis]SEL32422.1 Protein of unknown function, DUF488 [Nitrosovibrio tenuis]